MKETGIDLKINSKTYKVYFITLLILGDNLGLNTIFGFVESFARTVCCRSCYANPDQIKTLTKEDKSLMRTVQKYETDALLLHTSETGIKEKCIFNVLDDFHVIENQSVDIPHDLYEGMCNYVMTKILLKLIIEDECFSIDYMNYQLKTIDFGFESPNIPLDISLDYIKKHGKMRMSGSESLFFARYFGILVGSEVPQHNEIWELYEKLREIVHILTSPVITKSHILQLEILLTEHHILYTKYFGDLKPKFHFLLHYVKLISKFGPLIKLSTIRFESKHCEIKEMLKGCKSNVNILKTIGIRYQLSKMDLGFDHYENISTIYGPTIENIKDYLIFPQAQIKYVVSNVIINDISYKKNHNCC